MESSYFRVDTDSQSAVEGPLPLDTVISGLEEKYQDAFHKQLPPSFAASVGEMYCTASQSEEATRELRKFYTSKISDKKLQTHCVDVPAGILLGDLRGVICDVKIHSKGGPDDTVYRKNPDIRSKIPRGTTVLDIYGSETWTDAVIFGFKKFTGGIGDEDDNQPDSNDQWQDYCIADPHCTRKVVCMSKLNGEAAHFSGRYIDGHFYIIVGSKNVHMVIRERSHINLYEGSRYSFAKVIAETVYDTLNQLERRKQHLFYSFLHHTKCTVVCEILQPENQHIVNLSHQSKPHVVVISFTSTVSDETATSLTAFLPDTVLDLTKALGFHAASYEVIAYSDILLRKEKIRREIGIEGEVLYLVNEDGKTIGLIKVKAAWYILLRALREKAVYCFTAAKKKPGWRLSERITSTHKRLKEIQKWLRFSQKYLTRWEELSCEFLEWLNKEINKNNVNPQNIRPCFPCIWKKFLDSTHQTDEIKFI